MEALNGSNDLPYVLTCLLLLDLTTLLKKLIKLTPGAELKHQINVSIILIVIVNLQNVWVIQLVLNLYFQPNLVDKILLHNFLFGDNLDGIDVFSLFVADLVNFAKAADADVLAEE